MTNDQTTSIGVSRRSVLKATGVGLLGSTLLAGPAAARADQHRYWGTPVSVGDGEAQTYVITTGDGRPHSVGVLLSGGALSGLPSLDELGAPTQEFHLHLPEDLPEEVAENLVFEFAGLDWNPGGHDPIPLYGRPHFDVHFYSLPEADVERIPFGVADYEIPADQLPEGYVTNDAFGAPRVMVPAMGEHLADPTSSEFTSEEGFTHTLIWGAYDPSIDPANPSATREVTIELPGVGQVTQEVGVYEGDGVGELVFVEPMVTTAFLEGLRGTVRTAIKMPERFAEAGYYPTQYVIMRCRDRDGYIVAVQNFKWFEGDDEAA